MKRPETLHYAFGDSPFGVLLLAASEKGVVAIFLGDNPRDSLHQMERRFRDAVLVAGTAREVAWLKKLIGYANDASVGIDLPLDFRGTAFQSLVWRAVLALPPDSISTYRVIAADIGSPRAIRAVGNACAMNDFALVVPCHRVFHSDGTLGGTRWGLQRQRQLVEHDIPGIFDGQHVPVERLKIDLKQVVGEKVP